MGYIILIMGILLAFGGWTLYQRNEAVNEYKADFDAAQKVIDAQAKKLEAEQQNHVDDMVTAYEQAEKELRPVVQRIYVKGQAYATSDKGLSNPVCVMADDSLRLLRSALASLRAPADPGVAAPAVPGPGATGSADVQRPVPELPQEHGTVGPVREDARAAGAPSAVSGAGAPAIHPKPVPIH